MPNLSKLTSGELMAAKNATDYLAGLHRKHGVLDPDLWSKLDTFSADLQAAIEDHQARERRGRVAEAARRASTLPTTA